MRYVLWCIRTKWTISRGYAEVLIRRRWEKCGEAITKKELEALKNVTPYNRLGYSNFHILKKNENPRNKIGIACRIFWSDSDPTTDWQMR